MRKRFMALITMLLVLPLCACSNDDVNETFSNTPSNINEDKQTAVAEESGLEAESDFTQYEETEEVDYNGLIIQRIFIDSSDPENYHATVSLTCLDIDTGTSDSVSDFDFNLAKEGVDGYILPYSPHLVGEVANRESLDEGYDKLTLDEYSAETGLRTAGWMDKSGEFFDVTGYLGLESEYGIGYSAVGFLDDYFVFCEHIHETRRQYYSVPISDMKIENVKQSSNPYAERSQELAEKSLGLPRYDENTWRDEECVFFDAHSGSISGDSIYIVTKTSIDEFKPENYGCRNGIGNPDGTQFAYLVCTDEEQQLYDIHIANREDFSFIKDVEITDGEEYQFSMGRGHPEIGGINSTGNLAEEYYCHLIDWE